MARPIVVDMAAIFAGSGAAPDPALACPDGYSEEKWARMSDVSKQRILDVRRGDVRARLGLGKKAAKREVNWKPPFTTDYAIAWGKRQGWKLIDRERYNARLKRHSDLQLGMDAMFEGPNGLVMVQGAGRSERAEHYERFVTRGGEAKARHRHIEIYYVEFERERKEPLKVECWVSLGLDLSRP